MKKTGLRVFLFALLLSGAAQAEMPVPPLTQRVTDFTATLDAGQIKTLEARLAGFETSKGTQLAVLIVPTTQPETIEQFGIRVFESWKLGREGIDDGVLLLIAKTDHKLRLEVGYGLEGALNDAVSKRIIAETITPYLKRGEYYAGIDAGMTAIIKVVESESPSPPQETTGPSQQSELQPEPMQPSDDGPIFSFAEALVGIVGGVMLGLFLNLIARCFWGRWTSALVVGGAVGLVEWFINADVIITAIAVAIVLALSMILFSKVPKFAGRGQSSNSSFHSRDDSDRDSSSDSSSDFSGGGGSSGGGGASGDY